MAENLTNSSNLAQGKIRITSLWQFFWCLSDNARLLHLTNGYRKQKCFEMHLVFCEEVCVLEHNRHPFFNKPPTKKQQPQRQPSIEFNPANMMQGGVMPHTTSVLCEISLILHTFWRIPV